MLDRLRERMLTPELTKTFTQAFDEEDMRLVKSAGADRAKLSHELELVEAG